MDGQAQPGLSASKERGLSQNPPRSAAQGVSRTSLVATLPCAAVRDVTTKTFKINRIIISNGYLTSGERQQLRWPAAGSRWQQPDVALAAGLAAAAILVDSVPVHQH